MRQQRKMVLINAAIYLILAAAVAILAFYAGRNKNEAAWSAFEDGIERVDPNTIVFKGSRVEVRFSEVLLNEQEETRKLIVCRQSGTVSVQMTNRVFEFLDMDILKRVQEVSYTGVGLFTVDLGKLTAADILQDEEAKTVTLRVASPKLEAIEIDPDGIMVGKTKEGLFARGDIKMTVAEYNALEKEIRTRLKESFDTAANGQKAAENAKEMVKAVYEPLVKAIDSRYTVEVVLC